MLDACLQNPNTSINSASSARPVRTAIVLVPTCNAGSQWTAFLSALLSQHSRPAVCVVIDSESIDGTVVAAEAAGLTVQRIKRADFNHGETRQQAIDRFAGAADFVVFLTQDAILADPQSLNLLLSAFDDNAVAAAYGRQLPHDNATVLAAHARLFNYPDKCHTSQLVDVPVRGIKTCFLSNSFAAYRVQALQEVGGFAKDVILGEDTHLAARLLQAGYAIRYHSGAMVYHSHNYSVVEEFQRYFDIGVFHAQQSRLMLAFGAAGHEGIKFVRSEVAYLLRHAPWRLPEAICRNCLKALAYRLGKKQASLPIAMRRFMSMSKGYWA